MLVAAYILASIEKGLRKVYSNSIPDNLLTPLLSIFYDTFLTFSFVGPSLDVGYWLSDGLTWLYEFGGAIGGLIFGLLYAPIVITGMHHSFIAVENDINCRCH